MPRVGAKARRVALAKRIADHLFSGGTGTRATRLVLVQEEKSGDAVVARAYDLGGWSEAAVAAVIEPFLRPGQRRQAPRG